MMSSADSISKLARKIKVNVTTINNAMKVLRKNEIIDRIGARKNGTWIVNQYFWRCLY